MKHLLDSAMSSIYSVELKDIRRGQRLNMIFISETERTLIFDIVESNNCFIVYHLSVKTNLFLKNLLFVTNYSCFGCPHISDIIVHTNTQ